MDTKKMQFLIRLNEAKQQRAIEEENARKKKEAEEAAHLKEVDKSNYPKPDEQS